MRGIAAAALLLSVPLASCGSAGGAAGDEALERRVQALEDEKAIREVLVRYGEYLDARDYGAYAALFAGDGVWVGGFGSVSGPAAIERMLIDNIGPAEPGFVNRENFHLMTTMVVDVDGDTATARSRYLFLAADEDERPRLALAGRYADEFVREDGAWKIQRRVTHGVIPWRDGESANAR